MGRVVKGAKMAPQRYTITPPPLAARPRALTFDEEDERVRALHASAVASFDEQQTQEPQVDPSALRAEADALIEQASRDAAALIERAQSQALELLAQAQERAAEIETQARQEGFTQGEGDGRNAAQAEMDEMLETMRGLVEMARVERFKIIEDAEPEIVRLATTLAERILSHHVAVEPGTVLEMAKSAISRLVSREKVTVRVNPADIELMREHRARLMSLNDIDHLRIIEDQRVDRGGVLIETEAGTVDAKISTQLREARRLLAVEEPLVLAPAETILSEAAAQAS